MGPALQRKDYCIVFTASVGTLEDTLLFFQCDLNEARLRHEGLERALDRMTAVEAGDLSPDGSYTRYFFIEGNEIRQGCCDTPRRPALVHFLHFAGRAEPEMHQRLSGRIGRAGIPMANAYNGAVANCDSKLRMSEILGEKGVPTPFTRMISRFNPRRREALEEIRRQVYPHDLYVQPDRGTEGEMCVLLKSGEPGQACMGCMEGEEDFVVRKKVGNLKVFNRDFVLRMNVSRRRDGYFCESGYCMIGSEVVSAGKGAIKADINRVFGELGLDERQIRGIAGAACDAVMSIGRDGEAPLVAGVDAVLERQADLVAYIIDINPRPVVVGSRIFKTGCIGLGDGYWQAVAEKIGCDDCLRAA